MRQGLDLDQLEVQPERPHEALTPHRNNYDTDHDFVHGLRSWNSRVNFLSRLADEEQYEKSVRGRIRGALRSVGGPGALIHGATMGMNLFGGGLPLALTGYATIAGQLAQGGYNLRELQERQQHAIAMSEIYDVFPEHVYLDPNSKQLVSLIDPTADVPDHFISRVSGFEKEMGISVPNRYREWIDSMATLSA